MKTVKPCNTYFLFVDKDRVDNPQQTVADKAQEELARERPKSDTESVNSDKQVAEWIENQQRNRTNKPYREQQEKQLQADSLRSKSESNILGTGRPKSCPPPIAPKPSLMSSKMVILNRNANEGFGFVIISSPVAKGSVIGEQTSITSMHSFFHVFIYSMYFLS